MGPGYIGEMGRDFVLVLGPQGVDLLVIIQPTQGQCWCFLHSKLPLEPEQEAINELQNPSNSACI